MERALIIPCAGYRLVGVFHPGAAGARQGLLIIVGGPQYRIGSHRQFVLLARHVARAGIPVMRFDYRGMGDSDGEAIDFERCGDDIAAAVARLVAESPGIERIVLWGLCDAASAACLYAPGDPRISGLVLLNPWVRTAAGLARAHLRHYYWQRLRSPEFWAKLRGGALHWRRTIDDLLGFVRAATWPDDPSRGSSTGSGAQPSKPLPERMLRGLETWSGRVLVILSGNDLVAEEFRDLVHGSARWRRLMAAPRVSWRELPAANHTFALGAWQDQIQDWTMDWLLTDQDTRRV
jgi:exosortase A-associated hydrolase 1